jgi:hypothetical protein
VYFGSCVRMGMQGSGLQMGNVGEVWGVRKRERFRVEAGKVNPRPSTRTKQRGIEAGFMSGRER